MLSRIWSKRGLVQMAAFVSLAAVLSGCGTSSGAGIVATYSGGTVTQSQLDTQIHIEQLFNPKMSTTNAVKTAVVKNYIVLDRFLVPKAKQAGVQVSNAQVQQALLSIKQQAVQSLFSGSATAFDAKMQALHLTQNDLIPVVRDQMMMQSYAQKLVKTIPLSAQKQYYKSNQSQYTLVTERAILVKKLALAQQIKKMLVSGGSWKKLAKQYSQDPGSANNGGEYVKQNPSQWVPPFAQHALTQPLNVVGNPFNTTYGYFVMEVLDRTVQPFDLVKSQIVSQLTQQQQQKAFTALVTQLQSKANIKVTL